MRFDGEMTEKRAEAAGDRERGERKRFLERECEGGD